MIKVNKLVETIFSHAVSLDQSGRMKNTIFCSDRTIFILNGEHTILLRFDLDKNQKPFQEPISFNAADYDSDQFYEENGRIVFFQKGAELTKKKVCGKPTIQIDELFALNAKIGQYPIVGSVSLNKDSLQFFDESMSHVEIGIKDGVYFFLQRDIFTGTICIMEKSSDIGLGLSASLDKPVPGAFVPVGIRTADMYALFSFSNRIEFLIPQWGAIGGPEFLYIHNENDSLRGIISCCLFDDLGKINYLGDDAPKEEGDGREKPKDGNGEQKADRPTQGNGLFQGVNQPGKEGGRLIRRR